MYHERRHNRGSRSNFFNNEGITKSAKNHWIIGSQSVDGFRETPNMPHFISGSKGEELAKKIATAIRRRYGDTIEARFFEKGDKYLSLIEVSPDQFIYVYVEHGVEDGDHGSGKRTINMDEKPNNRLGMD